MEFSGRLFNQCNAGPFNFKVDIFDGVDIITATHVNVEKKIFNPYSGICHSIVCLDVYGFKPFQKLVLHYLIGKAQGVCGASTSGNITTEFG